MPRASQAARMLSRRVMSCGPAATSSVPVRAYCTAAPESSTMPATNSS